MLTVAVLGSVEVRLDGDLIPVPSGKSTEVLVRLALDAGLVVQADRILEDLWATTAFGAARNTLQSKVSQLRRALGRPGLITGSHGGYLLGIERADVDALRVLDLATATSELLRTGQIAAALSRSAEGLALFRGEPLVDVGDGEWLHPHRARLARVRMDLLQDNVAARVQLGTGSEVIGELEGLVRQYPLHENLWYWLMTALYRGGRQADALAAYSRVRKTLFDELGLQPGRDLQELEKRILDQDPDLATSRQQEPAPSAPLAPWPATCPGCPRRSSAEDVDVADVLLQIREPTPGHGGRHAGSRKDQTRHRGRPAVPVRRRNLARPTRYRRPGDTACTRLSPRLLNLPSEQRAHRTVRRRRHTHRAGQLRTRHRRCCRSGQSTARLDRRAAHPGDQPAAHRSRRRDRLLRWSR